MARNNPVPIRFSDREVEMQQQLGKMVGTDNVSESVRYALGYAHLDIVVRRKLKKGETLMIVPDDLIPAIQMFLKERKRS